MKKFWIKAGFTLCLAFFSLTVAAQDDAAYLTYKQKLMASNGLHMGLIGQVLRGGLPYKDQIKFHALTVESNNRMFAEASKKKIVEGRTDSKANVWTNWDQFAKAAEDSANAAKALAEAGDAAVMGKVRELGATCGACHQTFRKPKNQRFKR